MIRAPSRHLRLIFGSKTRFVAGVALTLASAAVAQTKPRGSGAPPRTTRVIAFETDEGTAMNVDVSPDGREIVFDILGDIYTLPISGGKAKLLVSGRSWDVAPRYSPDGSRILFVSDRGNGLEALWTVDRAGKNPMLLVGGDTLRLHSPIWSSDGREIILGRGAFGPRVVIANVAAHRIDTLHTAGADTATAKSSASRAWVYSGSLTPDGRYLYFSEDYLSFPSARLVRIDRRTGERVVLSDTAHKVGEYKPLVSRTGRWLAYFRQGAHASAALHVRDLQSGADRELMPLTDADDSYRWGDDADVRANYTFTPDDRAIVLGMNGKIWSVPVDGRTPAVIAFTAAVSQEVFPAMRVRPRRLADGPLELRGIRAPSFSADGRTLVFGAVGRVWVEDLATKKIRRLTTSEDGEYAPAISPDGRSVAYLSYVDTLQVLDGKPAGRNRVMFARLARDANAAVAGGTPRVLTPAVSEYTRPIWFPDNRRVLTSLPDTAVKGALKRSLVWMDTTAGAPTTISSEPIHPTNPTYVGATEDRLPARVSADGTRIYYLESGRISPANAYDGTLEEMHLRSMKLDGSDHRTHLTIKRNLEVASIAPDGRHLLFAPRIPTGVYLTNIPGIGDQPQTVGLKDPTVRRVSTSPITNAGWLDAATAFYALGPAVSRVDSAGQAHGTPDVVHLTLPRYRPQGTVAIRGARIVTMAGDRGRELVIPRGTLVVKNGRIVAVGDVAKVAVPPGATVIDGAGETIVPGFIDTHEHGSGGTSTPPGPTVDPDWISQLAYGVTSQYNPCCVSAEMNLEQQEMIETGRATGPRHFYSGEALTPGDYPIATLEEARGIVALFDALGAVDLKEYMHHIRTQRQFIAQAAAERGIGLTSEGDGMKSNLTFVADGFSSWEHASFITPIFKDVTTFLARSGLNFTPTIVTMQGSSAGELVQGPAFFYPEMVRETPADTSKFFRFRWHRYLRDRMADDPNQPITRPFDELRIGHLARAVAAIINAGGTVSVGAHNSPGLFTQWEMWSIRRGGASAMDALRAGTLNSAKKLGIDQDVGTIEIGKLADFVVLDANPLDDMRNTAKIRYVVVNGAIFDGPTMTRLWPSYQKLPRMGWQAPETYARLAFPSPLGN